MIPSEMLNSQKISKLTITLISNTSYQAKTMKILMKNHLQQKHTQSIVDSY